jgi:hypothetical protein
MIIAMITVRMVQPAVYEVIDMIAMRHLCMSAAWTVSMRAVDLRGAVHGICGRHGPNCGHTAVRHDGHVDYLHDGHLHHMHEDHVDEHVIPIDGQS